ncbi:flavodoxin family protein [Bacillus mojavensis]|uniref:flavodoxin family protein n=1 Tax=Bacillus mojavensis TaxID=72360 RepID=UPI002DBE443B|nr:flavodoxin family protein [Bacillus mojavensis]MEC1736817.1 flavodoxin family protein [Bacillus mojavensis]MEC1796614.1 flavodoxin family protein [Bacillus mojavensis]
MKIAVINGGTRTGGNTDILTEKAVQGLAAESIHLREYRIQPIEDFRHDSNGFRPVMDDYDSIVERILPCDILIFATPIYWLGMSGTLKLFIDRWSQTMRDPRFPDFKEQMSAKQAYVIAVGGDNPKIKGLPLIEQFGHIFDFMGMSFEGYVLGEGNRPGDIIFDQQAIEAVGRLLKRSDAV